jgi:hypothetical protein
MALSRSYWRVLASARVNSGSKTEKGAQRARWRVSCSRYEFRTRPASQRRVAALVTPSAQSLVHFAFQGLFDDQLHAFAHQFARVKVFLHQILYLLILYGLARRSPATLGLHPRSAPYAQ